jgi:hypothetical protein
VAIPGQTLFVGALLSSGALAFASFRIVRLSARYGAKTLFFAFRFEWLFADLTGIHHTSF